MIWVILAILLIIIVSGVRKIPEGGLGRVLRAGKIRRKSVGPGITWLVPFIDRLEVVSGEPFSVSLPPQSAITKDEIPIQLQASMEAQVINEDLAVSSVKDWRIHLMSQLQDLMKDRLEDLDFDDLDSVFPSWVESIRIALEDKASGIGVKITDLQISNLSPRTRPAD